MDITMSADEFFKIIKSFYNKIDEYRNTLFNITLLDIPYDYKKMIFEEINKLYKNLEKLEKGE